MNIITSLLHRNGFNFILSIHIDGILLKGLIPHRIHDLFKKAFVEIKILKGFIL